MRARTLTMVLVALGLAFSAAWMANNWVKARLSGDKEAGTGVVVAALEIPFGKRIEATDLRMVSLPPNAIPAGAYRDIKSVIGNVATQTIYAGETLLSGRVAKFLSGSTLAAVIAPNHRAVTVRVNDVIGVAGFLLPGNRVDVIATRRKNGRTRVDSYTLLQDKKVLAVDQTASPDKDKPVIVRAVTLELTPFEAESLVRATQEGTVQMALRNPTDDMVNKQTPKKKVVHRRSLVTYVTVLKGTDAERYRVKR